MLEILPDTSGEIATKAARGSVWGVPAESVASAGPRFSPRQQSGLSQQSGEATDGRSAR